MGKAEWLREFVAIFVENDLGIKLTHQQVRHVAAGGRLEGDAVRLPAAHQAVSVNTLYPIMEVL